MTPFETLLRPFIHGGFEHFLIPASMRFWLDIECYEARPLETPEDNPQISPINADETMRNTGIEEEVPGKPVAERGMNNEKYAMMRDRPLFELKSLTPSTWAKPPKTSTPQAS